jgi:hypothetical protein
VARNLTSRSDRGTGGGFFLCFGSAILCSRRRNNIRAERFVTDDL